jgi:hypothetical protein
MSARCQASGLSLCTHPPPTHIPHYALKNRLSLVLLGGATAVAAVLVQLVAAQAD